MSRLQDPMGDDLPVWKKVAMACAGFGSWVWSMGMIGAVPYYNWQYATNHGFVSWLFLGEIIATFKGIVWPYFLAIAIFGSSDSLTPSQREETIEPRQLPAENPFSEYPELAALMESGTYYNDASSIVIRFATGAKPTDADLKKLLAVLRKARDLAETINADKLDAVYPSLGRAFNDLYLPGLRLRVDAMENPKKGKTQEANVLLEKWDDWYRENAEAFKARLRKIGIPV